MELFPGIAVHFIQSKKFKTNKITMRFTAPLSLDLISGRMLSASMLKLLIKAIQLLRFLENIWQHCMEQICQLMLIEGGKVT